MKEKQFEGQHSDEEVLFVFRRHPIVMRKGFIILLICILIGALVGSFLGRNATEVSELFTKFFLPVGIGLVVGLAGLFYYWIGWYYTVCVVTDQRFYQTQQTGLFKKRSVNDISLHRILSVNYEISGITETVLGFGTIIIQTLVGDFVIRKVPKPAKCQESIVRAIKESGVELREEADI